MFACIFLENENKYGHSFNFALFKISFRLSTFDLGHGNDYNENIHFDQIDKFHM